MPDLPPRLPDDGQFPFGRPNGPRPIRLARSGSNRQVVIGIYPSALHVDWTAPAHVDRLAGTTGRVRSLAVDVEPSVFWDGFDAEERISRWSQEVGFIEGDDPGCHGHLGPATNGPSGSGLLTDYFPALPVTVDDTAFLDAYPVYFVKRGSAPAKGNLLPRGQADVMENEYNAVVDQLPGFARATLPERPSEARLPQLAADRFGDWLTSSLAALEPEYVVTLGEEVCTVLRRVSTDFDPTFESLSQTRAAGEYGEPRTLTVGGRGVPWIPLAHPGLIRQAAASRSAWNTAHQDWLSGR